MRSIGDQIKGSTDFSISEEIPRYLVLKQKISQTTPILKRAHTQ